MNISTNEHLQKIEHFIPVQVWTCTSRGNIAIHHFLTYQDYAIGVFFNII
jgi:hypothetical protein